MAKKTIGQVVADIHKARNRKSVKKVAKKDVKKPVEQTEVKVQEDK